MTVPPADPASIEPGAPPSPAGRSRPWLTKGVTGIGVASLLADVGHEIPTALLASFMTVILGAPAAALGFVEGLSDAISGFAKLAGGALADDPQRRRRRVALGGYVATAILSASVGLATTAVAGRGAALLRVGGSRHPRPGPQRAPRRRRGSPGSSAVPTGSSAPSTTPARSSGRCSRSRWSPRSASAARSCCR